ncbi:DUF6094 domain-containing protein [Gracilibacillus sp. YIM 98692]|uniref:DUF6094 domain-containing protein n=1 Tax=Gracilibacillus sp. YIM 98692 TaxID=2663532 RepID=UPI001F0A010A|nr:DUF6094 domain-containing protein [Gracilibacillus sp. YIM 98692]
MSHIGNKLKAGFFKTPEKQGEYLKQLIDVNGDCSFFDPTCGEGAILHQLASYYRNEETSITTYGVELDKGRAEKADSVLDHVVNGPIESMVVSHNVFSFLFLNPPYDHTQKGLEDDISDRKEWLELTRNFKYLKENGVMVYIIPSYRFADKKIRRYLSTNFYDAGILRFSSEDYEDFKQCIFIGRKKSGTVKKVNKKLHQFLENMEEEAFIDKYVSPIEQIIGHKVWHVPSGATEVKTFYSKLEEKSNFYKGIRESKGFAAFKERSKPKQLSIGGNPALPINQGQMALLLASGAINGEMGQGDHYHLVQGLELVDKVVEIDKNVQENGNVTEVTKERTQRSVSVKIITPEGVVRKLV